MIGEVVHSAARGAPGAADRRGPQQQFDEWALETEIAPGKGAARRGGKWRVTAAEVTTQDAALGRGLRHPAQCRLRVRHPASHDGRRVDLPRAHINLSRQPQRSRSWPLRSKEMNYAPKVGL